MAESVGFRQYEASLPAFQTALPRGRVPLKGPAAACLDGQARLHPLAAPFHGYFSPIASSECNAAAGHDAGGAGFHFGTSFLKPRPNRVVATAWEIEAPMHKDQTPSQKDRPRPERPVSPPPLPDPVMDSEPKHTFPAAGFSPALRPPHHPVRRPRAQKQPPLAASAPIDRRTHHAAPFVVRIAPQDPCWHCETGPRTFGKIPPWRSFGSD
uniref:Uncharacterized protein n=1 Tax=Rhizochromulina marina TaxID=1034831 RepID=A0A7S2RKA0_9STRA|mmetsp:Transcript_17521/g.51262  ORF Transcript_17521/g.51262 Transcript_17521/m.51262 type:complete len:211 (+) Transcript_17521:243-875(+)